MKALHLLPAAAAALLIGGCSSMAPRHERPAAPVPATFPNADASTAGAATPAADLAWQDFFADARLKRLIAIALANNRDLRVAALNIEQARAQVDVRRADLWPTLNAGLTAARQPTAGGALARSWQAGLVVTGYELDLFGRVRSLGDAALAQYLGTEEARKAAQISLVATVAATHLALQVDDELLRITRQTLATREDSLRLTRLKFDNGVSSELDLRQAESLLEAARVALAQQTRQRALDENALTLLLGQPLPADLPAPVAFPSDAGLPDVPAGVPSEVLTRRPDVRQAEQQLVAANANIGAARAAFFPRIALTTSAGSASRELSGLFESGSFAWTWTAQLLQPIFDAGRNEANLSIAKTGREIAVAQYERAIQSAFREVADALAGRATLDEQLRAQAAQTRAEQRRFELADLRYRNGAASYLDVLDAQRSLFTAQQQLVQVQAQQVQSRVTLYRVLGGGWDAGSEAPPR
ncbi:MAG TPA: efflux transporter outer membrane subunit [Methylibium sp.]|uniref:efflux transporter outer membrane subunit n=1 Tax=Methylibium sp. TaxID=2067992 RepID=UPI002DBA8828|nr:efflux transporter outer membrane subunit [Methylibium sp.]HEU4458309.1 efflux transporter outer membrane subunit [Methylibium sp.]